jgi:hypothetical protein
MSTNKGDSTVFEMSFMVVSARSPSILQMKVLLNIA